jgi:hypothetical protein
VLTAQASASTIPSSGTTTTTITAFARDASNNLIANVPVTFTATSGGLSGATLVTDANGAATATLSTAGDPTVRTITVTATSGTLTANVDVAVTAGGDPGTPPTVSMGCGNGPAFQAGALCISTPNLSSGGSSSIQAVLQLTDGSLFTESTSVSFSSACIAQTTATVTTPVVTTSGIANTTYVAAGCSGADVITATAVVGGTPVSATGTITVAPSVIGSIIFVSATPTNVALRGTGTTTNPETSTVVFRVLDQGGGPRPGTTVNFSLNTTVGGIEVSPATAVSDVNGRVQTIVRGGTVSTPVRVTATVQGVTPVLATQSSQLTVTTGIPDQDSFSVSVACKNVEAWNRDGVVVGVTARLSDRFNNPVPDGTAVTFQTEGGSIVSQCTTTGGIGTCSVNWTSSNPRPTAAAPTVPLGDERAGRSTILGSAIGEESFTDTNGNGSFDNTEPFADMDERFLDRNENDAREGDEPIYDFNNNSSYDLADGFFNGVLCFDTAGRCNAQSTTGISSQNLIIMSHGVPTGLVPAPGTPIVVNAGSSVVFSSILGDLNSNPLPQGTTVQYAISGSGLTLSTPSQFTVPCTEEPQAFPVSIIAANPASDGAFTMTVTSPSGLISSFTYPVDVQ